MGRWVVEVDLHGEATDPRPYDGSDRSGARTVLTAFGTEWQGIGPTPAEALDLARRARSAVLPHVEDVVRRLEHALGILAQGGDDVMDHDLVDEVARLVGLTRMPPVVNVWTVRAWLVDLRRALAVP